MTTIRLAIYSGNRLSSKPWGENSVDVIVHGLVFEKVFFQNIDNLHELCYDPLNKGHVFLYRVCLGKNEGYK